MSVSWAGAPSASYTSQRPEKRAAFFLFTIEDGRLLGVESRAAGGPTDGPPQ